MYYNILVWKKQYIRLKIAFSGFCTDLWGEGTLPYAVHLQFCCWVDGNTFILLNGHINI